MWRVVGGEWRGRGLDPLICPYCFPTMKPVMFCMKSSGTPRCAHSWTKCAPFTALSENRMPSFATMPTS